MFRLWMEWDFGQDDIVFTSAEAAEKWVDSNENILEMFSEEKEKEYEGQKPFDFYGRCGLLGLKELKII